MANTFGLHRPIPEGTHLRMIGKGTSTLTLTQKTSIQKRIRFCEKASLRIQVCIIGAMAPSIDSSRTRSKYLTNGDGSLLASSTIGGEVVVWRSSDLKEVYRGNFGRHPIYLRFDPKMNRFLVIYGNGKDSLLQAIQVE